MFKAKINGRQCAVKRICKAQSPNISKILSEVSIHIRLSHQHILQLFNVLEDRKNVYLVMEMCHGGSLSHLISRLVEHRKSQACSYAATTGHTIKPVLPYVVIGSILRQLCSALEYLHRNFIIHRDINLNNILLVSLLSIPLSDQKKFLEDLNSVHIKLADYGLAIDLNATIQQVASPVMSTNVAMGNTICGTPGFISPEIWTQLRTGSPAVVSPKSDIYSLGSILFACIAGYTPSGNIVSIRIVTNWSLN